MQDVKQEKPSHYRDLKIDVIEFCQKNNLSFCVGNVIKYVVRAGKKGNAREDLLKARAYIDRMIEEAKTIVPSDK